MSQFIPNCLPLLIGSLPYDNHQKATDIIFQYTPELPLWPQLPVYHEEGMILQYIEGFPGVTELDGKIFINSVSDEFGSDLLGFYEDYLQVTEGDAGLDNTRFELSRRVARGFYTFVEAVEKNSTTVLALKGQTTGPITFCTALVDQDERAIYYDDQLRDAAIKLLAMKARWQTKKLAESGAQPIMFFDEPGLAGLGTSAFITITADDIVRDLGEVFAAVRAEKGLTGVHVCANTEWPVLFDSGVDIVSFDAYSYFDRLILYRDHLLRFFTGGGILASGIVPTSPEFIECETVDTLTDRWFAQAGQLVAAGIDEKTVFRQTLITPSCGCGTVTAAQAKKIMELTRGVSEKIRSTLLP